MEPLPHTALLPSDAKITLRKPKGERRLNGVRSKRAAPKKGGAGGKGVWGRPGDELRSLRDVFDKGDPNYDSEAEPYALQTYTPANSAEMLIEPLLEQYFASGLATELVDALEDLASTELAELLLSRALLKAFDRKSSERELVSLLISDFHSLHLLSSDAICSVFLDLLRDLKDIQLDTPDISNILARFIARSVADECISPSQLSSLRSDSSLSSLAREVVAHADNLLTMNHGLVRVDNIWGVTGGRKPVKVLTKKIVMLLTEFLSSHDVAEAERCVFELNVPHFHHEIVYEAILLAMQGTEEESQRLIRLLSAFSSSLILTPHQIRKGFQRAFDTLDDLVLDFPNGRKMLQHFSSLAIEAGINVTPPTSPVRESIDSVQDAAEAALARGRKRYASAGDGGEIKA